jgi:hypothetical protein
LKFYRNEKKIYFIWDFSQKICQVEFKEEAELKDWNRTTNNRWIHILSLFFINVNMLSLFNNKRRCYLLRVQMKTKCYTERGLQLWQGRVNYIIIVAYEIQIWNDRWYILNNCCYQIAASRDSIVYHNSFSNFE